MFFFVLDISYDDAVWQLYLFIAIDLKPDRI